jgi:hypothetical protein
MTPGQRPSARDTGTGARALVAAALSLGLLLARGTPSSAAPGNVLSNGAVAPLAGTTTTTFAFTVHYASAHGNAPTSVTAVAGSVVVAMSLVAGPPADGDYRGTALLPEGSWAVTFQATAKGFDPTLAGPTVVVTQVPPPPPPTPVPTPVATPVPTPRPTPGATSQPTQPAQTARPSPPPADPTPLAPTPLASATAVATASAVPSATARASGFVGGVVATPRPSQSGAPSIGGPRDERRGQLTTVIVGTALAVGVLAILGVIALWRRRREPVTAVDARIALLPPEARAAPTEEQAAARRRADWEDYNLENQPIGTVEYEPPTAKPDT